MNRPSSFHLFHVFVSVSLNNIPSITTTTTTSRSITDIMTRKSNGRLLQLSSLRPALLTLWSLLLAVPLFIGRVGWIRRLITSMPHIHVEFSDSDIDRESEQPPSEIDDAHQRVPRIIAPRPACGACGGLHGKFLPVNSEPTIPKYRVKL